MCLDSGRAEDGVVDGDLVDGAGEELDVVAASADREGGGGVAGQGGAPAGGDGGGLGAVDVDAAGDAVVAGADEVVPGARGDLAGPGDEGLVGGAARRPEDQL